MLGTWSLALIILLSRIDPDRSYELPQSADDVQVDCTPREQSVSEYLQRFKLRPTEVLVLIAVCATLTANIVTLRDDFRALSDDGGLNWRESQAVRYMPAAHAIRLLSHPGDVVAASDPWIVNFLTGRPCVLLPALRPGEMRLFLMRYRPRVLVSDVTREPNPVVKDDFGSIASRTWRQRDWELGTLWKQPWLEEVPLDDRREIRVFRVRYIPAVGNAAPARRAPGTK